MEVIIVFTVIYNRAGCDDIRFFKNREEYEEWLKRQYELAPDTKIVEIKEES